MPKALDVGAGAPNAGVGCAVVAALNPPPIKPLPVLAVPKTDPVLPIPGAVPAAGAVDAPKLKPVDPVVLPAVEPKLNPVLAAGC